MAKPTPKKTITKKISPMKKQSAPFGFFTKLFLIIALGVVLFLLAQKYRGQFLAGTINNVPVTRYELNQKMAEKYGKTAFDEIVSEKLLNQQLKKEKIVVSDQEVTDEMTKIIKDYGGDEAFKAALIQYGLTEAKAKDSIKQSLSLKKLIEKTYKIEITEEAIQKYYDDNAKTLFVDKKLPDVSAEIKTTLYQQEVYAKTQEWFTGIRKDVKVVTFI